MRREYINLAGLRTDGRRPHEVRRIRTRMGVLPHADGSAYFQIGMCKVLCAVFGPRQAVHRGLELHDRAIVTCTHSSASFSSTEYREKRRGGTDRHSIEIQDTVQQCFATVLRTKIHPRSQIDIQLQVLQTDGGQLCACINAATLALADAGIPMNDMIVACSAGVLDGTFVTDLNFLEESSGNPVVPIGLLARSDKISMVKMTSKIPLEKFEELLKQAQGGCRQIYQIIQGVVRERATRLLSARGIVG
eukprot:GSMAST32.ASY1.ANO1.171.1 assembled CDS